MSTITRRWQRAMVVAAVLVVAAVVATQYLHLTLPTAAVSPDDPPAGVDLLYVLGAQPHTLVAYDWTGHRRGSITVPSWVLRQDLRMAADGGAFRVEATGRGDSYAAYLDRLGRIVLETNNESFLSQLWSDDSRHLCIYDGSSIIVRLPGRPDRSVTVAADANLAGDIALEACSMRGDLAVLTSSTGIFAAPLATTTTVATVRISTGSVLSSQKWAAANVFSSIDAAYIAVAARDESEPTMIYRTNDLNTAVGLLDPFMQPVTFSGDDKQMLVLVPSPTGAAMEAVDWRTRRVAWSFDQAGTGFGATIARPNNHEFAIQLVVANGTTQGVVIARADGSTARLPYGIPVV